MKEELSISKEKLVSVEEGLHRGFEASAGKTRSTACKQFSRIATLILYVELILFVGWGCYTVWENYRIRSIEATKAADTVLPIYGPVNQLSADLQAVDDALKGLEDVLRKENIPMDVEESRSTLSSVNKSDGLTREALAEISEIPQVEKRKDESEKTVGERSYESKEVMDWSFPLLWSIHGLQSSDEVSSDIEEYDGRKNDSDRLIEASKDDQLTSTSVSSSSDENLEREKLELSTKSSTSVDETGPSFSAIPASKSKLSEILSGPEDFSEEYEDKYDDWLMSGTGEELLEQPEHTRQFLINLNFVDQLSRQQSGKGSSDEIDEIQLETKPEEALEAADMRHMNSRLSSSSEDMESLLDIMLRAYFRPSYSLEDVIFEEIESELGIERDDLINEWEEAMQRSDWEDDGLDQKYGWFRMFLPQLRLRMAPRAKPASKEERA